jgi:hypothetical protein
VSIPFDVVLIAAWFGNKLGCICRAAWLYYTVSNSRMLASITENFLCVRTRPQNLWMLRVQGAKLLFKVLRCLFLLTIKSHHAALLFRAQLDRELGAEVRTRNPDASADNTNNSNKVT